MLPFRSETSSTKRSLLTLFKTFKANKIDDACASQVEEEKLVTLGLAYGDILNYKQTFCQKKETHMWIEQMNLEGT